MALNEYKKKRRFDVSPEPSGERTTPKNPQSSLIYVVQKHRATQLHYDFRLEFRGTLLSWAVPKGPSLDPSVKRLAMQVEDHPVEYASFEGVIPEGEYGGGTVMVWDSGTWSAESPDVAAALEKGDLKFTLHGKKLKGSWVLVRTRGFGSSTKTSWLLIKHRDDFASSADIAQEKPRSAISNRLLSQIAKDGGGDAERAATGDPAPAGPSTIRQKTKPSTTKNAQKNTAAKSATGRAQKRRKTSA
jgi:bifunctional non-homologous end joining protein LigD